eukprot:6171994-Pleurochrysis_carterae.AAC.3
MPSLHPRHVIERRQAKQRLGVARRRGVSSGPQLPLCLSRRFAPQHNVLHRRQAGHRPRHRHPPRHRQPPLCPRPTSTRPRPQTPCHRRLHRQQTTPTMHRDTVHPENTFVDSSAPILIATRPTAPPHPCYSLAERSRLACTDATRAARSWRHPLPTPRGGSKRCSRITRDGPRRNAPR